MAISVEGYTGVDETLEAILRRIHVDRKTELIPSEDSYGRVLDSDVIAPSDVPAFAVSHMDGFAIVAKEVGGATPIKPARLGIAGESTLLRPTTRALRQGEAVKVATGARIPANADAVVPKEFTEQKGPTVSIKTPVESGRYVYEAGAETKQGDLVLPKGRELRAQDAGLLLSIGISKVRVHAKPRVSVLATGSELTDSTKPEPGKIRNSHSPVFLRLVERLGCSHIDLGIAKDDPNVVARMIRAALDKSDFVLTLGGTSVGTHDVVGSAISSLRPDAFYHGIRMDRGRVTGIAVVKGKPVLMMPGPIQGAMNAFVLFAVPIIDRLLGREEGIKIDATLGSDWQARKSFRNFTKIVYVTLTSGDGKIAEPLVRDTESAKVLSDAAGILIIPEEVTELKRGTKVTVEMVPGFSFVS